MKKLIYWLFGGLTLALVPLLALMYFHGPTLARDTQALTRAQELTIELIARVDYIETRCRMLTITKKYNELIARHGVDAINIPEDERARPIYKRAFIDMRDGQTPSRDRMLCQLALQYFGPDGTESQGLLKLR